MAKFLTDASRIEQLSEKGMYKLIDNELFKDYDGAIYLTWRNFKTDNFTWLKSNKWDIRCSHLHDVGCKYHGIARVLLTESELLKRGYLRKHNEMMICEDIPLMYLSIVEVTKKEINDIFFRMLQVADCPKIPKIIQYLYRIGVSLNLNWHLKKHNKLSLSIIYKT